MTDQSEIISKALSSVYTLNEKYFWTNSAIVYAWIINKKNKCDAYTNRRLQKIRAIIINNEKLKLVPSRLNPADIATRGMSPKALSENKLWFYGPQFLSMPASFWPSLRVGEKFEYLTVSEKSIVCDHVWRSSSGAHSPVTNNITKSDFTFETKFSDNLVNLPCDQVWGASSGTRASEKSENCGENGSACLLKTSTASRLSKIISLDKFSSLPKLFRVTAYVIRFKNKLLRLKRKDLENVDISTKDEDHTAFITAEELLRARSLWIRDVQHEYLITDEKTFDSLKKQLKLFCDQNGIWRCGGGRINNAKLNYDMKYPYIFLKSKFAELLVMNSHTDVKHNGMKETLNNMRK